MLNAGGRIEVSGTVTADGEGGAGGGSGGSILLRGGQGVTILPGGSVTARGGIGVTPPDSYPPGYCDGDDGLIRLDAWGKQPTVRGLVAPAPTILELPYLHAPAQPAQIGAMHPLQVYAPNGSWVFVAASLWPVTGVQTPFGRLGIDPALAVPVYATSAPPYPDHDPYAAIPWRIPNDPALVGQTIWLQALVRAPGLPVRLSNAVSVVVQ